VREGQRETERENKQTYILCFLKKEEEREGRERSRTRRRRKRGISFPLKTDPSRFSPYNLQSILITDKVLNKYILFKCFIGPLYQKALKE